MNWIVISFCLISGSQNTVEVKTETKVNPDPTFRLTDRETTHRSGLYGWGLELEFPMVGLRIGTGTTSAFGTGFVTGVALGWEFQDRIALRVYSSGGKAYGSRATVRYREGGENYRSKQAASWVGFEAGVGATYLFRGVFRSWVPYVGLDVAPQYHGYSYRFDETLQKLKAGTQLEQREDEGQNAASLSFRVGARAGLRLEVLSWLAFVVEFGLGFSRVDDATIGGTIGARDVRSDPENLWTLGLVYSLVVGL